MAKNKTYHVRVLKMGQCDVPGPEIYWMSHWDTWETLNFWMVVIQARGFTALINTGPPADLTELNEFWLHFAGERCQMIRKESERPEKALQSIGVDPSEVDYVFLSPLQGYATANVALFKNATICISRRGWIEDFHAPCTRCMCRGGFASRMMWSNTFVSPRRRRCACFQMKKRR